MSNDQELSDDALIEILSQGNKEEIKSCLSRLIKCSPKIADYFTQSICQKKLQQLFIGDLMKLFQMKELKQPNEESFTNAFIEIKNKMENSIPRSFIADVFGNMADFKFQAAQAMVTKTFPKQQSPHILKYIDETNNIYQQIQKQFKRILQKNNKYVSRFRPTPKFTKLSETMNYISDELLNSFYLYHNMSKSLRQNLLMKKFTFRFDMTFFIKDLNKYTEKLILSYQKILTSLMPISTSNISPYKLRFSALGQSFLNFEDGCLSFIETIKKQRAMNQLSSKEQVRLNLEHQTKISELEAQLVQSRTFIKNNQEYSEPLRNYASILMQNQQLRKKCLLDIGISKGRAEYLQKEISKRDHLIQQFRQERSKEEKENKSLPKQEKGPESS